MRRILYILKTTNPLPWDIRQQANEAFVEVILIQDATAIVLEGVPVFVVADPADKNSTYPLLSYKGMLEKIFGADTVMTW